MVHCRPALCQASELQVVGIANQQMEGIVPSFTSSLPHVALHNNCFKVLPDLRLKDNRTSESGGLNPWGLDLQNWGASGLPPI